jgi:NAD(P)-dependent dehydrogenase (short-subunit alcohol dehydrogenase family)
MMGRLDEKVLLLTGAASGIGRASAVRAAREGARLFLTDVVAAGLEETSKRVTELGAQVEIRTADISDEQQARASVAACVERYGRLDVLCNNAGIIAYERAHEMSLAFWRRILSVNLDGTFLMTREAIPHLLATRGAIVNLGSTAGLSGLAYGSAYSASKGAIHAFTRAIAVEYADQGLRANSICPASIQTGMGTANLPKGAKIALLNRLSSLHGAAGPEVIAEVVLFLASDEARFVTGTEIRVDGAALA